MADKKTTFQQLNGLFNLDGTSTASTNKTSNSKIILRGKTPDEIKRKNLEVQQQNALRNKFFNSTDHGFQKAMQYESARISAYIDYEGFEYYPIVASALDLLMEESTTIGENGKMLNIYSNNDRISKNLEELFYDTLNINTNLPFWTRNLVKYGNNFVHILGEKKKGIIASKQLVNYEMDRIERIVNGRNEVRFQQKETQDKYNQFEMIHFRLLTDDKYIPYGTSVLSKVRRVVRQLILAEDAMLTYRIVRAGEKKIFKIDVGNIDEDDVENYLDKVSSRFKKQQQVYPNDGQIDYRFNILGNDEDYFIPVRNSNVQTGIDTLPGACLALDTKIELLDGRSLELNEIIKEYEEGKKLWSYSINPEDGEVVPGKITWAGVTRKDTEVVRLVLSNGFSLTVTPDHKFPTKYEGIKQAKDLKGDYLWEFVKMTDDDKTLIFDHKSDKFISKRELVQKNIVDHSVYVVDVIEESENIDTGTITIDGHEEYHDYHNFALTCGVFTQNSNLNDINDISYLRDNLFTGIGIPKPFLGFQDSSGDGKNMAQMDIRFAKKINRIQQALIQELNKMAIIHLHLLGFGKDDLSNFTLSLTNPSTQEELLKMELLREKSQVYNDLTRIEGGVAPFSHTRAKRIIFSMSDKDIVEDFKMQRMERTLAQELTDTPIVIKKTGLFDDVDQIYGDGSLPPSQEGGDLEQGEGSLEANEPPTAADTDDAPQSPTDLPPVEGESLKKRQVMSEHEYESRLNALMNIGKKEKTTEKMNLMEMDDKNTSLNKKADSLSDELDELLNESQKFNTNEGEINMRNFHTNKMDEEFDLMKLNLKEAEDNKKQDKK